MYRLTGAQQTVVDQAKQITEQVIAPAAAQVDADRTFPQAAIDALDRAGFMGLTIAPELGGMGQNLRVMCAVLDQVAQGCASTAMIYLMHLCGVTAYAAAPTKTERYLRAAAAGNHLSTLAWSEFGSRSHFWAPVSQEVRKAGNVTLSAAKSFVTSAGVADGYVVTTKWSEAQSPLQSTLYLVLKQDAGVRVAGAWTGLGMRGNMSAPMRLDNVVVGEDRTLTEPGKGLDTMLGAVLPVFNTGSAAIGIGIAEASFAATQKHITTNRFTYNDSSLNDVPLERARLAQMRIEIDKARAHLASVVDAVENPGPTTLLMVLESKAAAADTAVKVTELGLLACGGAGFAANVGTERHFRDARAAQVMGPTTDLLHEFIGRALCGMEVF